MKLMQFFVTETGNGKIDETVRNNEDIMFGKKATADLRSCVTLQPSRNSNLGRSTILDYRIHIV